MQDKLRALFEAEGFRCDALTVQEKTVENRALNLRMPRRWIQAVFTYVGSAAAGAGAADAPSGQPGVQSISYSGHNGTGSHSDERALRCGASDADGWRDATAATVTPGDHQGAAAADATRPPQTVSGDSGACEEWDAPPDEGVLGSDVGGLFQEPVEMVQEAIALAPDFTVKASVALMCL